MEVQQFCLKWNNHQGNLINVFESLLSSESFVDVTLACEGSSIKAHKVILSACSPFFEELFKNNPCQHPIVIMKDMKLSDLKIIIQFMYKGEVNVSQDHLTELIKSAENLQIKGLTEIDLGNNSNENPKSISENDRILRDDKESIPYVNKPPPLIKKSDKKMVRPSENMDESIPSETLIPNQRSEYSHQPIYPGHYSASSSYSSQEQTEASNFKPKKLNQRSEIQTATTDTVRKYFQEQSDSNCNESDNSFMIEDKIDDVNPTSPKAFPLNSEVIMNVKSSPSHSSFPDCFEASDQNPLNDDEISNNEIDFDHFATNQMEPGPSSSHDVGTRKLEIRKGMEDPSKPKNTCPSCQKSYSTHYSMMNHLQHKHLHPGGIRCPICHKTFSWKNHLITHLRQAHNCGAKYSKQSPFTIAELVQKP